MIAGNRWKPVSSSLVYKVQNYYLGRISILEMALYILQLEFFIATESSSSEQFMKVMVLIKCNTQGSYSSMNETEMRSLLFEVNGCNLRESGCINSGNRIMFHPVLTQCK